MWQGQRIKGHNHSGPDLDLGTCSCYLEKSNIGVRMLLISQAVLPVCKTAFLYDSIFYSLIRQ